MYLTLLRFQIFNLILHYQLQSCIFTLNISLLSDILISYILFYGLHMHSVIQKLCILLTDSHLKQNEVVLVFSQLGISRSATIVMAYLIAENKWSLQASFLQQLVFYNLLGWRLSTNLCVKLLLVLHHCLNIKIILASTDAWLLYTLWDVLFRNFFWLESPGISRHAA